MGRPNRRIRGAPDISFYEDGVGIHGLSYIGQSLDGRGIHFAFTTDYGEPPDVTFFYIWRHVDKDEFISWSVHRPNVWIAPNPEFLAVGSWVARSIDCYVAVPAFRVGRDQRPPEETHRTEAEIFDMSQFRGKRQIKPHSIRMPDEGK